MNKSIAVLTAVAVGVSGGVTREANLRHDLPSREEVIENIRQLARESGFPDVVYKDENGIERVRPTRILLETPK
jgi:Ribonuclease G/E